MNISKIDQPQIISASRRTDIPAFYLDWLYQVLQRGWVRVTNPFNPRQSKKVDLRPESVHTLVLWSKDFSHVLKNPEPLKPYRLFFHYTLNDAQPILEPRVPPLDRRLEQMAELAQRYGPERICWRFDPIVFWQRTGQEQTNSKPFSSPFPLAEQSDVYHNAGAFTRLAEIIGNKGVRRCSVALVDPYKKAVQRMGAQSLRFVAPQPKTIRALGKFLRAACQRFGLDLSACCSPELLEVPGIERSRCIDGPALNLLAGTMPQTHAAQAAPQKANPTRKGCGCTQSQDIGDYRKQPCHHACLYCYANPIRDQRSGSSDQGLGFRV